MGVLEKCFFLCYDNKKKDDGYFCVTYYGLR